MYVCRTRNFDVVLTVFRFLFSLVNGFPVLRTFERIQAEKRDKKRLFSSDGRHGVLQALPQCRNLSEAEQAAQHSKQQQHHHHHHHQTSKSTSRSTTTTEAAQKNAGSTKSLYLEHGNPEKDARTKKRREGTRASSPRPQYLLLQHYINYCSETPKLYVSQYGTPVAYCKTYRRQLLLEQHAPGRIRGRLWGGLPDGSTLHRR